MSEPISTEKILNDWGRKFEPATGSRGQGGLPVTGSVKDWKLTISKDGWKYYKKELQQALDQYVANKVMERDAEYQEIFSWLLGESGDFPLSEPGKRYNWRTPLRKKLEELQKDKRGE